ncbi:hypothetical protein SUGI_0761550 [Cryptomeria japonica]|uniref:taxadien-5-alpha-ol O-acetyltransferase-like n=1 Tax=Cryptomeria japonica TaxID=3369 RepID=UPI0024148251|nr:taxadien-5-alpha-ol O-acetyltransferase-like [Cryptomeria japonica]GLJ37484.1 hypothetical protein SUGI_0761550 [Cryptomeria japonica]
MEKLNVKKSEPLMVAPFLPSPKAILSLSSIDNLFRGTSFNSLLVYNAHHSISEDPLNIIQKALSKVLVYYFPFAGRLTSTVNGELQVECTGEGVLFVEAMADNNLTFLRDFDHVYSSFQQLLLPLPLGTNDVQKSHLLIVQVTRFICGDFVVGVNFHHSICDGQGAGHFLQGLGQMARGEFKLSIEPIWNRGLLKAEELIHLNFYNLNSTMESACKPNSPPIVEKLVQTSFALAWQANTKALQIPYNQNVMLRFVVDMSRSINPQLPQGYYGNTMGRAIVEDTMQDLINGPLLRVVKMIKKSKLSLYETYLMPRKTCPPTVNGHKHENVL